MDNNDLENDILNLLSLICESCNRINELQSIYNIDDELFKSLIEVEPVTGIAKVKKNFIEIYNKSII